MRKILSIIALFAMFVSNAFGATEYYALLVGIDEYIEEPYSPGSDDDVDDIKMMLIQAGWDPDKIWVRKNSSATRYQITSSLSGLSEILDSDDVFLFLYSGHADGTGDDKGLITYEWGRISPSDLNTSLQAFYTNKIVTIISAPYSGLFESISVGEQIMSVGSTQGTNPGLDRNRQPFQWFTSTQEDEVAAPLPGLELAALHCQGVHRIAVNGHYPVSGGGVIGGGVEGHQPERLFLVVGEQGLVHGRVHVLVGQPGGVELVEVVAAGSFDAPGVGAVPVGRHEDHPFDAVSFDKAENLFPFFAVAVPGVLAVAFGAEVPGHRGAEHLEGPLRSGESFLQPGLLHRAEHGGVRPVGVGAVVAAFQHDKVDIADGKVVPAAGLGLAAAVCGIDPVPPEDIPYRPLPGRLFDVGAAPAVVGAEIVVIPDSVDRRDGKQLAILRPRLAPVVAVALHVG